jgi:hypothetical protein
MPGAAAVLVAVNVTELKPRASAFPATNAKLPKLEIDTKMPRRLNLPSAAEKKTYA